jgi:hypothetical protein
MIGTLHDWALDGAISHFLVLQGRASEGNHRDASVCECAVLADDTVING